MPDRTCITEGCGRGGKLTRKRCLRCYRYWLDHTPPSERPAPPRFAKSFDDFVVKRHAQGCWIWTGVSIRKGYGMWRGSQLAHRHSWERTNGPIPDGLWVLHHCDNPPCVNPAHLYLGTVVENAQDAMDRGRIHHPPRKAKCPRGHAMVGKNVRVLPKGYRTCRECDNAKSRAYQARRRAALREAASR